MNKNKKVYVKLTADQFKELILDLVKMESFSADMRKLLESAVYDAEKIELGSSKAERNK